MSTLDPARPRAPRPSAGRTVRLWMASGLWIAFGAAACAAAPRVSASQGMELLTIGDTGNPAYAGGEFGGNAGRGGVAYEYRIGRTEVTTSQWIEFVNHYTTLGPAYEFFGLPTGTWGAGIDPNYGGPGIRYTLRTDIPDAGLVPVRGFSWRDAARYCNWMHNDRAPTLAAIASGAYDTATFTANPDGTYNDQLTRSPGARFWIPSLDEWLKAAHYDPNKNGPGQPGWWMYSHSSDSPPLPGVPGVGQTSAGFTLPFNREIYIPLTAYPDVRSPWGLLDTSGGAAEWNEEVYPQGSGVRTRGVDGTWAPSGPDLLFLDSADQLTALFPVGGSGFAGLRIAATVPGCSSVSVLVFFGGSISLIRCRGGAK